MRLALALIEQGKHAVIINADSAQVYADLPILSAQPNGEEQQGVPHRLYGAWDGADSCSAADWAVRARAEIAEAHAADVVPIVVGGTGLYLRTLLDGIAPHLLDGCVGTISEIFDADAPHAPRGCYAQAWSVAEVLRAWQALESMRTARQLSKVKHG